MTVPPRVLPPVCCDLDGVLWRGTEPIPGAAAAIDRLRDAGFRVTFLTNNSSRPVRDVVRQLDGMGVPTPVDDVLTSAQAAAGLLATRVEPGARVLVCAGPGVAEALRDEGYEVVSDSPAAAVVVGWHRDFDFERLDRAASAVRDGAVFIATNVDATYPAEGRLLPGSGAIVAAVAAAAGRAPEVAGKPEAPTVELVRRRLGSRGVVVGDRPSTDGALAAALGWPFALVLSGVAGPHPSSGGEPVPEPRPPFVAADLAALASALIAAEWARGWPRSGSAPILPALRPRRSIPMAQGPDWKQFLDAGAQFVAVTRAEARRRARDLVAQGQLAQGQVQAFVDDLVEQSRARTDEMLDVVRREIQRQVKAFGIATKDDLARLEARLARPTRKPAAKAKKSAKKPAKKAGKRKGAARKPGAGRPSAR